MGQRHGFSSCLAASSHSTTSWKETAQEDQCWRGNRIIWWNFRRFVETIRSHSKYCGSCNIFKLMAYTEMLFIVFQSCQSLEDHLITTEGNPQPYLLATGTSIAQVSSFYIVLDRKLLPCQSCTSMGAFDELFKAHFVFSVKYDDALSSLYTFLQTTLYNIDIGRTDETPRVKELRARLLNKQ